MGTESEHSKQPTQNVRRLNRAEKAGKVQAAKLRKARREDAQKKKHQNGNNHK